MKIVSDGTPAGTFVHDASGSVMDNVHGIEFKLEVDDIISEVKLIVRNIEFEISIDEDKVKMEGYNE